MMNNIMRFKNGRSVVEIEPFHQAENGITYTLYYYPNGLLEDYDLNNVESFDTIQEAIEKAKKILKM